MSTVQSHGDTLMVRGMFSWHTLSLFIPINHHLNATAYLCTLADNILASLHDHNFTHHQMAISKMIVNHVMEQKSSQTGFINLTMSSVFFCGLLSHWN